MPLALVICVSVGLVRGYPYPCEFLRKVFKELGLGLDLGVLCGLKVPLSGIECG